MSQPVKRKGTTMSGSPELWSTVRVVNKDLAADGVPIGEDCQVVGRIDADGESLLVIECKGMLYAVSATSLVTVAEEG